MVELPISAKFSFEFGLEPPYVIGHLLFRLELFSGFKGRC
jgi:hypothetical protein